MTHKNSEYVKSLIPSFYGCDGGNLNYPVWFCGIEHGGDFDTNKQEISEAFKANKKFDVPSSWSKNDPNYADSIYAIGNVNRYICAIYAYYSGLADLESTFPFDQDFVDQNKILCEGGIGFKMNIFPFRKKSLNSNKPSEFNKLTGNNYLDVVLQQRREFFLQQIKNSQTKLIICFGISRVNEFYDFFAKNPQETSIKHDLFIVEKNNGAKKHIDTYEFESTNDCKILVMPFLGKPAGLNGYKEMFQFAEILKARQLG